MAEDATDGPVCFVRPDDVPGFVWGAYTARVSNPLHFTADDSGGEWRALGIDPSRVASALAEVSGEEVYLLSQADLETYGTDERSLLLASAMAEMPVAMAVDPGLQRHGVSGFGGRRTLGRRSDALRLMGGAPPAMGSNPVVVFVVDTGIDRNWMARTAPGRLIGTLGSVAGPLESAIDSAAGLPRRHAHVTVRNVLAMAPEALIVDVRLLPATVMDFAAFLHRVYFVFRTIRVFAAVLRQGLPEAGIVVVNPWAVYDSARAKGVGIDYLTDRTHAVNVEVIAASQERIDCVFAAGNTSRLVRDPRVGAYDGEPYRSIYGANALPEALCVTSVRTDGLWPGHASRGPAAPFATIAPVAGTATASPSLWQRLIDAFRAVFGGAAAAKAAETVSQAAPPPKPDVAAPSEFAEDTDASAANAGTSASCALGAGVIAAARSHNHALGTPDLFGRLRQTARPLPQQTGWNGRLGQGVIDVGRFWPTL